METTKVKMAILLPILFVFAALLYKTIDELTSVAPPPVRDVYDCTSKDLQAEFYGQCVLLVSRLEFFDDPQIRAQAIEELSFENGPKGSGCQLKTEAGITGKYRVNNKVGHHRFRCQGTYIAKTAPVIETWLEYNKN